MMDAPFAYLITGDAAILPLLSGNKRKLLFFKGGLLALPVTAKVETKYWQKRIAKLKQRWRHQTVKVLHV